MLGLNRIRAKGTVILDPLFFLLLIYGSLSLTLIAVLLQNNVVIVGKTMTIIGMAGIGAVIVLFMVAVKQLTLRFEGFNFLLSKHVGLIVLAILGGTWLAQYVVFTGFGQRLGIVDVLQSKVFYSSVGIFEEIFFGLALFLGVNALVKNFAFSAMNVLLNALIFTIYHATVFPNTLDLWMVFLPRLIWNCIYLIFPVPSAIMLGHFSWNWLIS